MVQTDSSGKYSFKSVAPGKYNIEASHPSWAFSQSKVSVELTWGQTEVSDKIVVSGFSVSGQVVMEGNTGIEGVDVILYSKDSAGKVSCETGAEKASKLSHGVKDIGTALCVVKTDDNGKFIFKGVTCASYTVVPVYRPAYVLLSLL
jgi:protocatechuate 3,4-dioxygenase beta subunit